MFVLNKDINLDARLLEKMIVNFHTYQLPALIKNKNYYDGKQKISSFEYANQDKTRSRIITNYCKNIADSYCGYLASPGYISYNSDSDITEIMDTLRYNDYQDADSDFLMDALIYGTASELMYTDEDANIRFRLINPTTCFGIYDDSLSNDLLYFVRWYKINDWDESSNYKVDVYSNSDIKHYEMSTASIYGDKSHKDELKTTGALTYIGEEAHYFNQCPANIFTLDDEKSIFDCIIGLQDAANELLSDEVDDFSAFCDAYLILTGADIDQNDVEMMKKSRAMSLPEGASAQWLTKSSSDTQVENILKRIHDSIYRIAACPDFSSETFVGGVSSGIAIRYRLTGMETRAARIAASMKKALLRRVELIAGMAALSIGEEVFRDVSIDMKRNIPEDSSSYVNLVNSLQGIVSDKTLLSQIPFISDVNEEIDAIKEQKQENISLYQFPSSDSAEDEENEDE